MPMMRPVSQLVRRGMTSVLLVVALGGSGAEWTAFGGEDDGARPLPTIAILQELAAEAGHEVVPSLPGDSASAVVLAIEPADNTWFVEAGFTKGLAPRRVVRDPGVNAVVAVSVGITSMGVAYENVRRDALFGDRIVTRTVFLEAELSVANRTSGEVVHRTTVNRSRRDDVRVDDLSRLEEPGLTWTTAKVPPEGFFSSVLEPVITVGAIAVAVILLFTVRS